MAEKRKISFIIILSSLLVLLIFTISLSIIGFSSFINKNPSFAKHLPRILSPIKPVWKAKFKQELKEKLAGSSNSYLPQCFNCKSTNCNEELDTFLGKCIKKHDRNIPFFVYEGAKNGQAIGQCIDEEFFLSFGETNNSQGCLDSYNKLLQLAGKNIEKAKNLGQENSFENFLESSPILKAITDRDKSLIEKAKLAHQHTLNKNIKELVQITREIKSPYLKRVALESDEIDKLEIIFEDAINIINSSQCSKLISIGTKLYTKEEIKEDELSDSVKSLEKDININSTSKLQSELISKLKEIPEIKTSLSQLEINVDSILTNKMPREIIVLLNEMGTNPEKTCEFFEKLSENYKTLEPNDKENILRYFLYSFNNN